MSNKKEDIIDVGIALFIEKGYNNAGLSEILKTAKVPKGSFYYYFKSKEDFGIEVLKKYSLKHLQNFQKSLTNKNLSPKSRIIQYYTSMISEMETTHFSKGCLLGESCTEGNMSDAFTNTVTIELGKWDERMKACIQEGQKNNEINTKKNARILSALIINGWEGALLRMKSSKSALPLQDFIFGLDILLE